VCAAIERPGKRVWRHEIGHHQWTPQSRKTCGIAARVDNRPDFDLIVGPEPFDQGCAHKT
jgi:hypothetical protein